MHKPGTPEGSDTVNEGHGRGGGDGDRTKPMSTGIPRAGAGEDGGLSTKSFENLNAKDGGEWGGDPAITKALGEVGGLAKCHVNSSITEHKDVTLPAEGGPDRQRS